MTLPSGTDATDSNEVLVSGGQAVFASNVLQWLGGGWTLFTRSPGIWIVNILILFVLSVAMAFVPIVGSLASNLLAPVFLAGLLLGCRDLDMGEPLRVDHLFAGFKDKFGPLVLIGLLLMVGVILAIIAIVVILAVSFGAAIFDAFGESEAMANLFAEQGISMVVMLILLCLGLFLPLGMAYWFAPALVVFHNQEPLTAMKNSFFGCIRNIAPGILYFILLMVLTIIGVVPIGLGLLIVVPMMYGSIYVSYKDIFLEK